MKFVILLVSIALATSSCVKETTTKIISENPTVTEKNTSASTSEGTVNGGGGKGVQCTRNGITTVETLDLYEARVIYGLTSNYSPQDETEAKDLYSNLLANHFWNPSTIPLVDYKKLFLLTMQETIWDNIKFISSDKKLKLTEDSFEPLLEKNCEMVQVATYYDESILLIDESLWNQMDWLNKISLMAHESIYFIDRTYGSTNSMASRKLVGQMFSTKGAVPKSAGIPIDSDKYVTCMLFNEKNVSVSYFYVYDKKTTSDGYPLPKESEGLEFVFNYFLNNTNLFRTSTFIHLIKIDELFQPDFKRISMSFLEIEGYQTRTQTLLINFTGSGQGNVIVSDSKTGISIGSLSLSCARN